MPESPPKAPRPSGRPRVAERSTLVTAYVPVREYERLWQLARDRDQSVSRTIRDLLRRRLR
jgi:hypothetical protein